ncbi:MAG: YcaO-like family protein [Bdellovibrionota bacterium]
MHPQELYIKFPLGLSWSNPEVHIEKVTVGDIEIHTVGVVSHASDFGEVWGSAAGLKASPVERAYFELLERIAIVEAESGQTDLGTINASGEAKDTVSYDKIFPESTAPSEWIFSRSNGVAIGRTISSAQLRSACELIERHRVLNMWYKKKAPKPYPDSCDINESKFYDTYTFHKYDFGYVKVGDNPVFVVGVLGVPKNPAWPEVMGFGSYSSFEYALKKAFEECIQRIGFLWGEEYSDFDKIIFSPSPLYHQEVYLSGHGRRLLATWLSGNASLNDSGDEFDITWADLTPERWRGKLHVLRAISGEAIPLIFGRWNPSSLDEMMIHPIA